jgi:hypothetical protein
VYFTDVIVRRDHPARTFADLHGRGWAYNDEGSHSGYNLVRHHLLALGETRGYFGRVVASGAHQCSIQMVLDGTIDASGIDSTVLEIETDRRPELDAGLRTIAVIGPSPIPPVVVARGSTRHGRHASERSPRDVGGPRAALRRPADGTTIRDGPRAGRRLTPCAGRDGAGPRRPGSSPRGEGGGVS